MKGDDRLHMAYSFELVDPAYSAARHRHEIEAFFDAAGELVGPRGGASLAGSALRLGANGHAFVRTDEPVRTARPAGAWAVPDFLTRVASTGPLTYHSKRRR